MFNHLIDHLIYKEPKYPQLNKKVYQYILAGNGLFLQAENRFVQVMMQIAPCEVRGLFRLEPQLKLKIAQLPGHLLTKVIQDARREKRPSGQLHETLYQFGHINNQIQLFKPPQITTPTSVITAFLKEFIMQKLSITPTYRVLLGEANHIHIMLVGIGGTGSALALALGRLAYHAKEKGIEVRLTFVDHDLIEAKNIGRQCFAPVEIGYNKAESLALRLNCAFGLNIQAIAKPISSDLIRQWQPTYHSGSNNALIIGAVDNYLARREIAEAIENTNGAIWCIDTGNDRYNGQILMGNESDPKGIDWNKALHLCTGLLSPYKQEPDILEPPPKVEPLSCAQLTLAEAQSLMINQTIATVAGQYVSQFVLERELTQMATYINVRPFVARTKLITVSCSRLK